MIEIDIVIISNAKNTEARKLTEQTIESLLISEPSNEIKFYIIVVESEKTAENYHYPNTITIKPSVPFGYHTYLNIGVRAGKSPFIGLANNDLIFHKGWASAILAEMRKDSSLESAGTWCDIFHGSRNIPIRPTVQKGYTNGVQVTGWFLFLTRNLYNRMNGLDENFSFWYCDNDYAKTLESMGVNHALITTAKITHITSQSTVKLNTSDFNRLTLLPNLYFDYKWNHRSYLVYLIKKLILTIRLKWN